MGTKLNNAPVYYTVGQVLFNPILDLESYLSAIQPRMRDANFPDYRPEVVQKLVFPFGGQENIPTQAPVLTSHTRHVFGDISGRANFVLDTNSLVFQTTEYGTFETFLETFLTGLRILHEALRLSFVERIGL